MKRLVNIFALLFSIMALTGCFESSDLIGKWQADPINVMGVNVGGGPQNVMEFKSGSIVSNANGVESETKVDSYVSDKDRRGVVIKNGDNKQTIWFTLKDKDTIVQSAGVLEITYQRVK